MSPQFDNIFTLAGLVIGAPAVLGGVAAFFGSRREQKQNEEQIAEIGGVFDRALQLATTGDGSILVRGPADGEVEFRGGARPPRPGTQRPATTPDQRVLDVLAARATARFKIQETHYANALRQSTTYFYASLFVGLAGFALIMTGVVLALADSVAVGTVTGIGGLLTDGAAALVFTQANRAKADAQSNLQSIARAAERDENNLMAFVLASRIDDDGVRDDTHAALARQLIAGPAAAPVEAQEAPAVSSSEAT